jgi:hypothetical protein
MIFVFTVPLQAAVAALARILSEDQPLQTRKDSLICHILRAFPENARSNYDFQKF